MCLPRAIIADLTYTVSAVYYPSLKTYIIRTFIEDVNGKIMFLFSVQSTSFFNNIHFHDSFSLNLGY